MLVISRDAFLLTYFDMSYDQAFNKLMRLPFEQLFIEDIRLDEMKKGDMFNNPTFATIGNGIVPHYNYGDSIIIDKRLPKFLDALCRAKHPNFRIQITTFKNDIGRLEFRLLFDNHNRPFDIIEFDKNEFVHWLLEGQIHNEMKDDDTIEKYIIK